LRLLFDQNLSPRLPDRLADLFPASTHVSFLGLEQATDEDVWMYAKMHSYAIVTKDADFSDIGVVLGFPPKIVWLRLGNCTTRDIERCLRINGPAVVSLDDDPHTGILILSHDAHLPRG
jgi:predicted nuclease of predicted toxin-antitoxin system